MWPKRITLGLAGLACLLLTGGAAFAQEGVRDLPALQLFEPADCRPYDGWDAPKEGFFFSFDGIFWTISAPKKAPVGVPGGTTDVPPFETNSFDTGDFRAKEVQGDEMEFGYTGEHHGFLVDTYELNCQTQIIFGDYVSVIFQEHLFPLPIGNVAAEFLHLTISDRVETSGVEALYTYRQHQFERGGQLEWMFGGRWVWFQDEFNMFGQGSSAGSLTPVSTECDTTARNQIAGPEIGARYYQQFGRLAVSADGRFMAGINSQDIRQYGMFNGDLGLSPILFPAQAFASSDHKTTFTPLAELKLEGHLQLTRLLALKVGWTGIYMGGIARTADMVNYTVPQMSINSANNHQTVFMQGVNVGLELNR